MSNHLHLEGGMAPPDCGSLRADGPLGLASKLQDMLTREQASHRETQHELKIERAAHDDTAERLVEMQHRLEATLQELSNLERFVKGCSACSSVPSNTPPEREPLLIPPVQAAFRAGGAYEFCVHRCHPALIGEHRAQGQGCRCVSRR